MTPTENNQKNGKRSSFILGFLIALLACGIFFYFYTHTTGNKEKEAYEYAMKSTDPNVLQSYLDSYNDAPEEHRDSIIAHLSMLHSIDKDWTNAVVSNSKSMLEDYLAAHPDSPHKQEALSKIDSIDWETVSATNSIDAYNSYMEDHPSGEFFNQAKDAIKAIKAKTVQPEELQMISGSFRNFFHAIETRNEDALLSTVNNVLTSFLGKQDAIKSDVITFMHKIYKEDMTGMQWLLNNNYKISKKEVGEDEYEYTVTFSAIQNTEYTDASKNTQTKYRFNAKTGPDGKITELNMSRIIE
uniref:Uncharacterized protein n=1 Tax=Prevotella sp. GTC17260 TaxID=3236796 RepID=A0AB33JF72_9BACT